MIDLVPLGTFMSRDPADRHGITFFCSDIEDEYQRLVGRMAPPHEYVRRRDYPP